MMFPRLPSFEDDTAAECLILTHPTTSMMQMILGARYSYHFLGRNVYILIPRVGTTSHSLILLVKNARLAVRPASWEVESLRTTL